MNTTKMHEFAEVFAFAFVKAYTQVFDSSETPESKPEPAVEKAEKVEPKATPKAKKAEPEPETAASAVTLPELRSALGELSKAGKRDTVKEILAAFNAKKLSDIPESSYAEALKMAKAAA